MIYKLGEILEDKGYIRGPFGSALKRGEMKDVGIPVYEQQNAIYDNREFRYFIDEEKYEKLKRFTVQTDDLIVSCSGTVGRVSLIKENDEKGIISQALLVLRANKNLVLPKFLMYYFLSKEGRSNLIERSIGSVQVNLAKREYIEGIEISLPSLKEQERIVYYLDLLTEKLNCNSRMQKVFEDISELLYKQWFINFDFPNEQNLPYSSSGGEMIESDLGKIPKAWKVKKLGEIFNLKRGYDLPTKKRELGKIPIVSSSGVTGFHNEGKVKGPGVITGRSGLLGHVFYIIEEYFPLNTTLYVEDFKNNPPIYIYHLTQLSHPEMSRHRLK